MQSVNSLHYRNNRKKLTSSNSDADARLFTSTHKHTLKKLFSSLLSASGFFNVGVPFVAMRYNAFKGFWFKYGGSPSIISAKGNNSAGALKSTKPTWLAGSARVTHQ